VSRNKPEPIYNEEGKEICGAKRKSGGGLCQQRPMANGRCRYHGGKSPGAPKGNQNARTHGVWSTQLDDEDREFLSLSPAERLAQMQAMAELRTFRAHKAQFGGPQFDKNGEPITTSAETLDTAFMRNAKVAATIAQTRIKLAGSTIDRDDSGQEAQSSAKRIQKLAGILDTGAEAGISKRSGPSALDTSEPAAD